MPLVQKDQIQQIGADLIALLGITQERIEIDELQNRVAKNTDAIQVLITPLCETPMITASNNKLQLAVAMSLAKLTEYNSKRKNGDPYFVHVLSVLNRTAVHHAPPGSKPKERVPAYIGAVLHDYFEEGDGVTPQSVDLIEKHFREYGRVFCEEIILLTEPNYKEFGQYENKQLAMIGAFIDYDQLKKQYDLSRKVLEGLLMAYVYSNGILPKAVVPNDKLDNIDNFPLNAALRVQKKHPEFTKESEEYSAAVVDELCDMYTVAIFYAQKCGGPAGNKLAGEVLKQFNKIEVDFPKFPEKLAEAVRDNFAQQFYMTLGNEHPMIIAMREYCNKLNLHLIAEDLR
jgi:hypothetical protein